MRNLLIFIMISVLSGVCACSGDPTEPTIGELEVKVAENCYILLGAIEAYKEATANYWSSDIGVYPQSVTIADPRDFGFTLVDFLPNGELLENPFTGEHTEPSTDTIATEPGQIGYGVISYLGANQVYAITGYGEDSLVVLLHNIKEVEDRIIYDCFLVRNTVQHYIDSHNGSYPNESELIEALPEGINLINNMTLTFTNPWFGYSAAVAGEIGVRYSYSVPAYGYLGYIVTGCGVFSGSQIFEWVTYMGETELTISCSEDILPLEWMLSTFKQYE